MSSPLSLTIDLNEKFPELKPAPIIEAAIHWQAQPSKTLDPIGLKEELIRKLPDYPLCEPQQDIEIVVGIPESISEMTSRVQWNGYRLQDNNHHVAQFTPQGAVFSRLEPYENWQNFKHEAMRFWDIFLEIAAPASAQRLGLRYINRIPIKNDEHPSTYIKISSPFNNLELQPTSFFYQNTYNVPGYPYQINLVRTVQPQQTLPIDSFDRFLIIDVDISISNESIDIQRQSLIQIFDEMSWIKNKIFFSCITPNAIERFGGRV